MLQGKSTKDDVDIKLLISRKKNTQAVFTAQASTEVKELQLSYNETHLEYHRLNSIRTTLWNMRGCADNIINNQGKLIPLYDVFDKDKVPCSNPLCGFCAAPMANNGNSILFPFKKPSFSNIKLKISP